jgi:hypothetical protein
LKRRSAAEEFRLSGPHAIDDLFVRTSLRASPRGQATDVPRTAIMKISS